MTERTGSPARSGPSSPAAATLVLATRNGGKLRELARILAPQGAGRHADPGRRA